MKVVLLSLGLVVMMHSAQSDPISTAAVCHFHGDLLGSRVTINQLANGASRFSGRVAPLSPGLHGLHVHENGDLSDHCDGAGGHYDPLRPHYDGDTREVGDLGNIEANEDGVAKFMFVDDLALLGGPHSIIGRAMVVHEAESGEKLDC